MTRVHVFVEGPTERAALPGMLAALGICAGVLPPLVLRGSKFFSQIGRRAAALLSETRGDHVFACPDLAPREHVPWHYEDHAGLQRALSEHVRRELTARYGRKPPEGALDRFHPHPFRHDFEVLLLAMPGALGRYLGAKTDVTRYFNHGRPEDQNFMRYPKRVVERLFRKFAGRRYDDVSDYPGIVDLATPEELRRAESLCRCFARLVTELRQVTGSK